MNWLKRQWTRYTHEHDHEIVACAEYVHVNKFTGVPEKFLAVWRRCACGHEHAEAIVNSYSTTVHIPIDVRKWHPVTLPLAAAEPAGRPAVAVKRGRPWRRRRAVVAAVR
jgi:hypothetical protein